MGLILSVVLALISASFYALSMLDVTSEKRMELIGSAIFFQLHAIFSVLLDRTKKND